MNLAGFWTSTSLRRNIFRIDHYLGKEPVQNILYHALCKFHLRAAVGSANYVRSIQITMAENFGVQDRGCVSTIAPAAIRGCPAKSTCCRFSPRSRWTRPRAKNTRRSATRKASLLKAVRPLDAKTCGSRAIQRLSKTSPASSRVLPWKHMSPAKLSYRQLALGGRADLYPHGQVLAGQRCRSCC